MFLFETFLEPFAIVDRKTVSDGMGGYKTEYVDGAEIEAVAVTQASTEQLQAEKMIGSATFQITTRRDVVLEYHTLLKRLSDGKIFRVVSDSRDVKTPKVATFEFCQCNAEAWENVE